jgi:hypothetical protein
VLGWNQRTADFNIWLGNATKAAAAELGDRVKRELVGYEPAEKHPTGWACRADRRSFASVKRRADRIAKRQKEPAIGDGCQSREDPQSKSIRSSAVCRNSHTHRKTKRIVTELTLARLGAC